MDRLNKTYGKNDTFVVSPIQDIPVKDTGFEYTPQRKSVREKSRSLSATSKLSDRLRFEKNKFARQHIPPLDLDQINILSETRRTADLNENQNSAFVSFSSAEQVNPSAASSKERHGSTVAGCLFNMWQSQRMCDIILKVDGHDFPGHKLALAAHSQGFANKFCANKNTADVAQIPVPNCSFEAAQEVMRYVYTSEINITLQNVDSVLSCAKYLGITDVVEQGKRFLLNHSIQEALTVMKISRKHELLDIFSNVYDYVCLNFNKVAKTDSFLRAHHTDMCHLLSDDNLCVQKELDVFFAATRWLDYNRQDRQQYVQDILCCIRFSHITPEEMVSHVEPKALPTEDCKDLLMGVFRYHALRYSGSQLTASERVLPERQYHPNRDSEGNNSPLGKRKSLFQPIPTKEDQQTLTTSFNRANGFVSTPLVGLSTKASVHNQPLPPRPPLMIASGGVNPFRTVDGDAPCRLVEEFNPYTNTWGLLTRMPDARHHHGSAVLDGQIYIIGGSLVECSDPGDLANPTNTCYRYDPYGNYWTCVASMYHNRMYHGVAVLGGVLYAIGGQNEFGESLPYVEFYNPDTDTWGGACAMTEAKIGAAAVGHRGLVYVVGGFLETVDEKVVLGTVECYDPMKNRWLGKNPLPGPRCHAGLVEVKDTLYLVGGSTFYDDSDAITSLDAILRLDDDHDRWDRVQTLRVPRHDAGVTAIGTQIYIVGGVTSSDNHALADVEVFDVATCDWLDGTDWLTHAALGISCCTLDANNES
ncbi:kelch-like protein diablo [Haliotis rufescens]|uniref:kelch-like protein diablo n=1 Tax=Haliotis rufescens TaxID=6454 RepID=UPI00201EF29D|nr:kelch-like protein diablo [Haliotis rufescens]